ncbi:MAG: hypothetical protein U0519_00080 [Candidatus Gracilibacteria bacterium]
MNGTGRFQDLVQQFGRADHLNFFLTNLFNIARFSNERLRSVQTTEASGTDRGKRTEIVVANMSCSCLGQRPADFIAMADGRKYNNFYKFEIHRCRIRSSKAPSS